MFGDLLSPMHLVLLLIVALLVFGPKRLPEIGKGLGDTLREFRKAMRTENLSPSQVASDESEGAPVADGIMAISQVSETQNPPTAPGQS